MSEEVTGMQELDNLLQQIVMQLNQRVRCFLIKKGLSQSRYWVIRNLSTDHPLTMGDLQKILGLSSATLTGLVDGLVEANLVYRRRDNNDRRVVSLTLTPSGVTLQAEVHRYRSELLQCALSGRQIDFNSLNDTLDIVLLNLKLYNSRMKDNL